MEQVDLFSLVLANIFGLFSVIIEKKNEIGIIIKSYSRDIGKNIRIL